MSKQPEVSLESQISAVWTAHDSAHRLPLIDTEGKMALMQAQLSAAARSLEWLKENRGWIVEAARAQKASGE